MTAVTDIVFDPWLPIWLVGAALLPALLFAVLAAIRSSRGLGWRIVFLAAAFVVLLNPAVTQEERRPIDDVAVIAVDRSPSMQIGERSVQRDQAVEALRRTLERRDGLDVRVVSAGPDPTTETTLFARLDSALTDVPRDRLSGVILVTDGQVHDVPESGWLDGQAPVHALIAGSRQASDRRLTIVDPPAFGIVNQTVEIQVEVTTGPAGPDWPLPTLTVRRDGAVIDTVPAGPDGRATLPVPLEHGGSTIIEVETPIMPGELTGANNRAAISVSGVRDRLRVLLVSGEPHMGERVWRNILKSDPSVDLVHFTILRPPEGQDGTPISELSLIAFPVRELFDAQIDQFDLIIFDRYRRRGVLHQTYLENIARFVEGGGALLEASGPDFAEVFSLYRTPLQRILPGRPTGTVTEAGFRPDLTDLGHRHPVTTGLDGAGDGEAEPVWGRWFRQIDVQADRGDVLMTGHGGLPLLMLDRVGDGRVAQVASDHMWLWARGFEGGGPQAELLRRVAHWLMREPSLEENRLTAEADGTRLRISRSLIAEEAAGPVQVTGPEGETVTVELQTVRTGQAEAELAVDRPGIFQVTDGERQALAVVGELSPPELTEVHASPQPLAPVVAGSGGASLWLADGVPDLRFVHPGRDTAGPNWLGLVDHDRYQVVGASQTALLPPWLAVLALLVPLIAGWRAEGR